MYMCVCMEFNLLTPFGAMTNLRISLKRHWYFFVRGGVQPLQARHKTHKAHKRLTQSKTVVSVRCREGYKGYSATDEYIYIANRVCFAECRKVDCSGMGWDWEYRSM